jgi:hypothetical protein
MRKISLLIPVLLLSASISYAQTAEDSVKTAIAKLFTAMKNSDSQSILAVFADSAILQTIAKDKNGNGVIKTEKVPEFAKVVSTMPKGAADERISFDMVKVDGPLATAWTPYKFYLNGQFSHCGVNSFQMVRINGEWKIQYLVDTRRKQPCE